ncbi:MAG: dUTP diphosphatase [Candidatus Anammoxibacter sp.]
MDIKIMLDEDYKDICMPRYASTGAACFDLAAAIEKTVMIMPGELVMVGTGVRMEIPAGYYGDIRPRSGLACKSKIMIANSPGTIDSDYRGEIKIGLLNMGKISFEVKPGMRIAQMMIKKFERWDFVVTERLGDTDRGEGGFGSTGD